MKEVGWYVDWGGMFNCHPKEVLLSVAQKGKIKISNTVEGSNQTKTF